MDDFLGEALVQQTGDELLLDEAPAGTVAIALVMALLTHVVAEHDLVFKAGVHQAAQQIHADGVGIVLHLAGTVIDQVSAGLGDLLVQPEVGVAVDVRHAELGAGQALVEPPSVWVCTAAPVARAARAAAFRPLISPGVA